MVESTETQKTVDSNNPIVISSTYKKQSFTISSFNKPYVQDIVIPEGLIKARVERLAADVAAYYENKPYTILVVMKQGYKVFNLLNEYLEKIYEKGVYNNTVRVEFIRLATSLLGESGEIEIVGLDLLDIKGKDLLIVEAIVETGLSLQSLLDGLKEKGAKSAKVLSLIIKENRTQFENYSIDFLGFIIPAKFVVGFGLDYNDNFRDINHIVSLTDTAIENFKKKKSNFSKSRQFID
mmetsp:Transcript_33248/g.38714  ORF Transcript_33248/g.38714 Transcript_33248/m.38714 type:complete len:237 (+) Transcript_33248:33-743(+)